MLGVYGVACNNIVISPRDVEGQKKEKKKKEKKRRRSIMHKHLLTHQQSQSQTTSAEKQVLSGFSRRRHAIPMRNPHDRSSPNHTDALTLCGLQKQR